MDFSLFKKYSPIFYKDANEPFIIQKVACTMYKENAKSVSSKYEIEFDAETEFVLEYAVYWDFDIQHLYDLEHVFLSIDKDGHIVDIISSFHGKFYRQKNAEFKDNHPILFLQPGKHAIMAHPEYFDLFKDLMSACNVKAGIDGILIPPFLENSLSYSAKDHQLIKEYIKKTYSFTPSYEYIEEERIDSKLISFDNLVELIPSYINEWVEIAKAL